MAYMDSLIAFVRRVGQDIGALTNKIGDVDTLKTTDKTSVVNALNELKSTVSTIKVGVDEAFVESISTQKVKAEIDKLVAGATHFCDLSISIWQSHNFTSNIKKERT